MKKSGILVAVFLLATGLISVRAGDVTVEILQEGKVYFENTCLECHGLDWPLKKIADRDGWDKILTMMANTGAILDPTDRPKVLEYLLAKSTFQKQCVGCHTTEKVLSMKKNYEDWLTIVKQCSSQKPGLLTESEIPAVSSFLTVGM